MWNERDPDDPLQQRITELTDRFVPKNVGRRGVDAGWRESLESSELFGAIEELRAHFDDRLDAKALVDRVATISFVAAAPPGDREQLAGELRALARVSGGEVAFRYVTQAYVTFSVA